jgi:hypothetical protein
LEQAMPRSTRALTAALTALAVLPAAASATTVTAEQATKRACPDLTTAASGSRGVAATRVVPGRTGVATVGVRAARGDWDLVVLDALTGRRLAAAASSSGREWTYAPATAGRAMTVLACRRPGASRRAAVTLRTWATDLRAAERTRASLVQVAVRGDAELRRLEATGLDVTHNHDHHAGTADVVLYGAGDRLKLLRAGFPLVRTLVADLRAHDDAVLRADLRRAESGARSALPSGRTTYRTLADYDADLKRVVDLAPGVARAVSIGRTLEDRSIDGVELAADVAREDDGRPTFLVLGVHHAREWPSGEMPMEFALDLAQRHAAGDPEVTALLQAVRVLVVPVVNRDGFEVSRTAGPLGPVDDTAAPLPLTLTDTAAYKRKNCRAPSPALQAVPCLLRPAVFGVDPNRNYGQFWGGVGSSTDPTSQGFRGAGPFSEPEPEAVHRLSSTRPVTAIISHHTYTAQGTWLRQPGFCKASRCDPDVDVVEHEDDLRELGDAMGEASGWQSQLGWAIGQITGATEDWNYFTQGTLGYTPEQRGANFHPSYAQAVVAEFDGTGPGARGGVREALMRAARTAADPAKHAVLDVSAAPGRTLRLRKAFDTPTSISGLVVKDAIDFTTKVPASGRLDWHVTQSSRPGCDDLPNCAVPAGTRESYTLTCEDADGTVLATREVVAERGERSRLELAC